MVDFTKPSGNHSTHPKLFQWVKDYFTEIEPSGRKEQSKLLSAVTNDITTEKQPSHSACGDNSSEGFSKSSEQNFLGEPDRKKTKFSSGGKVTYQRMIIHMYCIEVAAATSTIGCVDSMELPPLYLQHQGTALLYFCLNMSIQ